MFRECYYITELDLSSFDTSSLTRTDLMFYGCTSLSGAISYDSTKVDIGYANYENGYFTCKE